jgi:hypothetical protein
MILTVLHGVSGAGRAVVTAAVAVPGHVTLALIDVVVARAERAEIPLRVAERLLADGIAEQVAARLLEGPELERIAKLTVESPALHAAVADALDSEAMERLLSRVLETEGVQRLVTQVVESRVVEDAVARIIDDAAARLPDSEAMWALIDVIARSPAVTDAITQQGVGFADQVAGEVRDRSRTVDDRLERAARRLLRRRPRPIGGGGGAPASGAA